MSQELALNDRAFKGIAFGKLGIWVFLIIDGLSFTAILIAASYLCANGAPWPSPGQVLNVPLTAFNTFVLLLSSYTMMSALDAIRHDDQKRFKAFLWATFALGVAFLGIQAHEYSNLIGEHFIPSSSIYAGCFYGATGFHGLHVLSGVIFILYAALKKNFSAASHLRVEILTLFWHFVDLMWMLVFTVVYLL